jgi:VanZ family protein
MKNRLLKYWLPPFLWMIFIFPPFNPLADSSRFYDLTIRFLRWLFPEADSGTIWSMYVILRKSFHFMEYAVLAYLLFRAFRSGRTWAGYKRWIVYSGSFSAVFAVFDEGIQKLLPSRRGSLADVAVDIAGILFVLGLLSLLGRKKSYHPENFSIEQ